MEELKVLTDKRGRTFKTGRSLPGRPAVMVSRIARTGNFFQVDFSLARSAPVGAAVPAAIVMHVGDVETWEVR